MDEEYNLQTLKADLFLIHAPSVYDFRDRDDIVFAYLSDSDSVNVTSIYEMYPIGFLAIKQRLEEDGFKVEILNLASIMLMHPGVDVDGLLSRLDAPVFGLDLHWLAHCHGSIEVARRLKTIHPGSLTLFGGISATYYANELVRYPAVDIIVQGYDTLEPLSQLMDAVCRSGRRLQSIPNLIYKKNGSEIFSSGFTYRPVRNYNDVTVDWSFYDKVDHKHAQKKLIMTLPNTGCVHDCLWCGGSRSAYRKIMHVEKTLVKKDRRRIVEELHTMPASAKDTSIYALQYYSETKSRLFEFLDTVKAAGYKGVSFEQFHLIDKETLVKMGDSTRAYIMLSPESHDREISRCAGRGNYSMSEMESWIPMALDAGIAGIVVWFCIGMPRQTPQSVLETVAYCEALMKKFRGKLVIPVICPMVPFLDPGSRCFEDPQKHGYRIFYRSLEEHRRAMVEPLWFKRLNYETIWMSRREIQEITYKAIAKLVTIKAELGVLPDALSKTILSSIAETELLLAEVERALDSEGILPATLRDQILAYNRKIFMSSSDQIVPVAKSFGGRWFDDYTVPESMISSLCLS